MKVAIVSTHPIQYQVPWFRELAAQKNLDLKVYYALLPDQKQQGTGFGVSFQWDIPLLEGYNWEVIPNKRETPALKGFFNSSTPAVYTLLSKAKPDVVIITGWHALPLLQALAACLRLRIPRIVRGESNRMRQRALKTQLVHKLLLSRFDAFLSIGKSNREFYRQYGIPAERIFPCHYFIDNDRFNRQAQMISNERCTMRAAWNIPEKSVCYVSVGKLEPKKRILDLLQALELTRAARQDLHLLIVGTGELMDEAREFATSRSLPVTFAGFLNQTEVTRAYVAADCLVLPSDYGETWGLVVNEAMISGRPAIVSDRVGCWPDLVSEGVTGAVFPFGNVRNLADKLIEFADADKLAALGRQAKDLVANYSVEQAVAGTMRALEFAVSRPPNTARKYLAQASGE